MSYLVYSGDFFRLTDTVEKLFWLLNLCLWVLLFVFRVVHWGLCFPYQLWSCFSKALSCLTVTVPYIFTPVGFNISHCNAYQHDIYSSFSLSTGCKQKQKLQDFLRQNTKGPALDGLQERTGLDLSLCFHRGKSLKNVQALTSVQATRICNIFSSFSCFSLSFLLVLLYLILLLQLHNNLQGLKMQESFALPHSTDALLLALTVAHAKVLFITEPRLAATEISTVKTPITGNGKNLVLWFQGRKVAEDAGIQPRWAESWK